MNIAPNLSGVYKIINIVNGRFYIGSTKDIRKRCAYQFSFLRGGYHTNKEFQKDWNLYGEECFVIEVVELFKKESDWLDKEQELLLKYFDFECQCYNKHPLATAGGGRKGYKVKRKVKNDRFFLMNGQWVDRKGFCFFSETGKDN